MVDGLQILCGRMNNLSHSSERLTTFLFRAESNSQEHS